MSKLLFLAAIVGLAISSVAQSPPPPPSPTESAHEKQQTSSGINANSELLKQVTVLLKKQNEYTERQRQKDRDKSASDWWLVIFTGALTFAGVVQLVAMFRQAGYMRRGLRISIKAARSARFSAIAAQKAVRLAERNAAITGRAVVLVESVTVGNRTGEGSPLEGHNLIIVTLKNFGQTVANSVKLTGKMDGAVGQCPFPDDIPTSIIAPQGTLSWPFIKSLSEWPGLDNLRTVNERRAWLGYKIKVTYKDVFGQYSYQCEGRYEPALKQFL